MSEEKDVVKDIEKEERILLTSARLFGEQGYRETTMEEIAEQADVSKGLLFHYYGSKSGLYQATYAYTYTFFDQKVDYSVWTTAYNLSEMVVAATKYKIQLQLDYPIQFAFLMKMYTEVQTLPKPLADNMRELLSEGLAQGMTLTTEVIEHLSLQDGVEESDVMEIIQAILSSETKKIQQELAAHEEWTTMEDLMPVIDRLKRKLAIVERGAVK